MTRKKSSKIRWDLPGIKAELQRLGYTMARVEREFGLAEGAVRNGVRGNNRPGAEAVAKVLKRPLMELFPGFYLRRPAQDTHSPKPKASQKSGSGADSARAA